MWIRFKKRIVKIRLNCEKSNEIFLFAERLGEKLTNPDFGENENR